MLFRIWSNLGGGCGRRPDPRKAHRTRRIEPLETRQLFAAADIVAENLLPGSPESEWGIDGVGTGNIEGFAAQMSVDQGETVDFKINTDTADYRIDIYRMGWYGGLGARKVDTIAPLSDEPVFQPAPLFDPEVNLVDAGNWEVSASWDVPEDAVSGVYIAKLVREDTFGENHIIFVVRDDDGQSEILFQTSDTTWQAYNNWGGFSLYYPNYPNGRARAVSYNRPFVSREVNFADYYFGVEFAMTRFLERNGYDVSYTTGIDTAVRGEEILEHEIFISVGHDEYWSGEQRANVEAARDAGVHLAFFSGNEVYWKSRWEESIDGSGTDFRTMVTYKETVDGAKTDPSDEWTGTWRDPRFQCCGLGGCLGCPGPASSGRPENELTGTIFTANQILQNQVNFATNMTVSSDYAALRFWRNTEIAELLEGDFLNVGEHVLGYEFNEDLDNGFRPAGLVPLSSTTLQIAQKLLDYGATFGPGIVTHAMTMYRAESGALVFGAGTVQYAWGLDDGHDGQQVDPDRNMQQATINLFADMGVQPTTLMEGLVPATASTDNIGPTSTITSPATGSFVDADSEFTITGTAQDQGGGVIGAVEVSVDGGRSWHRASGTENWSYSFTPRTTGEFTVLSRAVDDSLNLEQNGPSITLNPSQSSGVYTLWSGDRVPGGVDGGDEASIEVGVKITPETDGYITGVRFYKSFANTGTHVGNLWTGNGDLLATATFTNESESGWQQVDFDVPVAVQAGEVYIASYFAPNGHYSFDIDYFTTYGVTNGPLHASREGALGSNGLFIYSAGSAFPSNTFRSANYWVDVEFTTNIAPDIIAPTATNVTPANDATEVSTSVNPRIEFSEPMHPWTINADTIRLLDGATPVSATVSYDANSRTATLNPAVPLDRSKTYTISVSGATDLSGNSVAENTSFNFTTVDQEAIVASLWDDGTVPSVVNIGESASLELGVRFSSSSDGYISGIRFYKSSGNTGAHIGNLWTSSGQLLATGLFANETSSGWQELTFSTPVAINAGETYVASYFAPNGNFSVDRFYFGSAFSNAPLSVAASGGVFRYGNTSGFPTDSFVDSNYWVDVVMVSSPPVDNTAPTVTNITPADSAIDVSVNTTPQVTFSEEIDPGTINTNNIRLTAEGLFVDASVSYDAGANRVTLTPTSPLSNEQTYTIEISGITDLAGNALTSTVTSEFTTVALPPVDNTPPTVSSVTPADNAVDVSTNVAPQIVFSEDLDASTVNAINVRLLIGNTSVAASVSYNATTRTATITPNSALDNFSTYAVEVSGVTDLAGNRLSGRFTSSFTTALPLPSLEQTNSLWDNDPTPSVINIEESDSLELGVRFSSSSDGYISGIRFYKSSGNTGTHTGNLWSSSGQLLATATFTNESSSGWQEVEFDVPVAINAGETYVASYFAPNGNFSVDRFYFNSAYNNGPLRVAASGGVFRYGNSSGFPTFSYADSNYWVDVVMVNTPPVDNTAPTVTNITPADNTSNVSIDTTPQITFSEELDQSTVNSTNIRLLAGNTPVAASVSYNANTNRATITPNSPLDNEQSYTIEVSGVTDLAGNALSSTVTSAFTTVALPPVDTTPPTVTNITPSGGASDVSVNVAPRIVFNESMDAATINANNVRLLDGNTPVASSVSYNVNTRTATITPNSPLDNLRTYTVEVSGATDLAGNALATTVTSTFTTELPPPNTEDQASLWDTNATPSIVNIEEADSLELGVRFSSSSDGYISGIRFYKSSGNTGTHTGNLWSSSGQLLATATFTNESSSGWQEVEFDVPVAINAGETYVASYFAPNGNFSVDRFYFDSAYNNGPLSVEASGGVFRYGNSSGFPTFSYADSNYWVDVVMVTTPPASLFFQGVSSQSSTVAAEGIYPDGGQIAFGLYAPAGLNDFDPTKTNMERVAEEGFTLAGPFYNYEWEGLEYIHEAAENGLQFTYQIRAHSSLNGVSFEDRTATIAALSDEEIANVVREQVESVIDDPIANATVARWAILPEEARFWASEDLRYVRIAVETLRQVEAERGVASRPVWNYQANNRTAEQLIITGQGFDVITKGTYLTTMEDRGPERAGLAMWNFDQIVEAADALDATPQAVLQLYEDFTDPLTGTDAEEIERVIRHDVYLALVRGIKSLNVFSMFENRPNLTTHNEQFEAYGSVATDLTGSLDLQTVFLLGEQRDDLNVQPTVGPATFVYTHSDGQNFEYPTLNVANFALGDQRYVVLVNSTESPMSVDVSGLPGAYQVEDLFVGTTTVQTDTTFTTTIGRLGVKVLRFSQIT